VESAGAKGCSVPAGIGGGVSSHYREETWGGGCMLWKAREMGGAGGQGIILSHSPGAQLGPPCYQYDDSGSRIVEDVVSAMQCSLCVENQTATGYVLYVSDLLVRMDATRPPSQMAPSSTTPSPRSRWDV
jgi:hypothetical protein